MWREYDRARTLGSRGALLLAERGRRGRNMQCMGEAEDSHFCYVFDTILLRYWLGYRWACVCLVKVVERTKLQYFSQRCLYVQEHPKSIQSTTLVAARGLGSGSGPGVRPRREMRQPTHRPAAVYSRSIGSSCTIAWGFKSVSQLVLGYS